MSVMRYLVFAQTADARVGLAAIVTNATRYFDQSVEVLEEVGGSPGGPPPEETLARIAVRRPNGPRVIHAVASRRTDADDLALAREAQERGRAAGMATLAERCRFVWEVVAEDAEAADPASGAAIEATTLAFLALLASVALGPVLPPDRSTLFGVRGAMERAERRMRGPLDQKA